MVRTAFQSRNRLHNTSFNRRLRVRGPADRADAYAKAGAGGSAKLRRASRHEHLDIPKQCARTLRWFPRFVEIGYHDAHVPACNFLPRVRPAGVLCETEMLEATKGINTHKGAIFALGLLCSAAGRILANGIAVTRERICMEVASICEDLVSRDLRGNKAAATAGERSFHLYGITGARGEAASGYGIVRSVTLPLYDRLQANGTSEEMAWLQVLLHLLAFNADTNLVSRGGLAGLDYVRGYSRQLLLDGGVLVRDGLKKMATFDDELITRNLSPGGSADLLAVTVFLANLPTGAQHA